MEVLDYYSSKDRATIKAFGTQGIARYLTASAFDVRQITRQEVDDAHALGLTVFLFFEENPTYPSYFTFAQGQEDCRQAQVRLKELGAPDGTVVYFTVDTNIEPSLCDVYFNGVESAVTPALVPGAYGYQRFCEYAYQNYPNVGKHLWQTYGRPTVPLDGYQHLQESRAGVEVDVNDVSAPGWTKKQEADLAFKDDPDAQAFVKDVRDTLEAIKSRLTIDAHHKHLTPVGFSSEPAVPPVPGATYAGASSDLSLIIWNYNGKNHFFQNGVELP